MSKTIIYNEFSNALNLTIKNRPNKKYIPNDIFKNILGYCGDPLPKDINYCGGFNCEMTKSYYRRKDGQIDYKHIQKLISCKKCKVKYPNTGYAFCGNCYKDNKCIICNKTKSNPLYSSCWECNKPSKKGVCLMDTDSDDD